jgi:3-oxoacyl-[acyl-carrier-protein] synthase-3
MRCALRVNGTKVSGFSGYRPGRLVDSDELAESADVDAAWIREKTGIATRHHADPGETVVMMAIAAGERALAATGVPLGDIDLVILTTSTRGQQVPSGAPQVASGLGIQDAGAFDLNAACASFSYALALASNAVAVGQARHVLITAAERPTDYLDPEIADTYVIFGDGAGAAVVSPSDDWGIGPVCWGSDGSRSSAIEVRSRPGGTDVVMMDGQVVYRWAVNAMPAVARRACELAGVSLGDVRWFVPHQASRRIIDRLAASLGFSDGQVARDVVDTGNTSSATIPLAMERLYREADVKADDLALFVGFGAGLSYSAQVVRLS